MKTQNLPIIKRLVPSVRKRMARLLWPDGHGIVRRDGALFLLNIGNWSDKMVLEWGLNEIPQRTYLAEAIRQRGCDTFIDIGANFGTYTVYVGTHTKCDIIFSYEPDQRSYEKLCSNLLINGLTKKAVTRMAAVSDHNGTVPFMHASSDHDYLSKVGEEGPDSHPVPAVRLDDELPLKGRRLALKIDVEGHEIAALNGMKALLADNECFLQVECWEQNAKPFIDAMTAIGYRLVHRIEVDHYFEANRTG